MKQEYKQQRKTKCLKCGVENTIAEQRDIMCSVSQGKARLSGLKII